MNPHIETGPSLHLPSPTSGGDFSPTPETPHAEFSPNPPSGAAVTSQAITVAPTLQAHPTNLPLQPADDSQSTTLVPSDDTKGDDLDKEWVNKAKAVVEQTKNDPYSQSHAIEQVKADYLRVRYNKHIKVNQQKL